MEEPAESQQPGYSQCTVCCALPHVPSLGTRSQELGAGDEAGRGLGRGQTSLLWCWSCVWGVWVGLWISPSPWDSGAEVWGEFTWAPVSQRLGGLLRLWQASSLLGWAGGERSLLYPLWDVSVFVSDWKLNDHLWGDAYKQVWLSVWATSVLGVVR